MLKFQVDRQLLQLLSFIGILSSSLLKKRVRRRKTEFVQELKMVQKKYAHKQIIQKYRMYVYVR